MPAIEPIELTRALIRCPSVTPDAGAALDVLEAALRPHGFACRRLVFEAPDTAPVDNLYARWGEDEPVLAFCGHVDVVPPGDRACWSVDPFAAEIRDGQLIGRGAADMKSGVAAFAAAAAAFVARRPDCSVALLITGDEEGKAVNGTVRLLEWAAQAGERFAGCLVGEPTSSEVLGDMAKIGRRGSLSGRLTVHGRQGHTAYPQRADNAAHRLVAALSALTAEPIDGGTEWFEPTNLQVTSIDIGNLADNVIPGDATATFNIRFNDAQDRSRLEAWLRRRIEPHAPDHMLDVWGNAEAFVTRPGLLTDTLVAAVEAETGRRPALSTSGGTSDARFVQRWCPVVEFGLVGRTIHQVDERVPVEDIASLTRIYETFLNRWSRAT